MALTAQDLDRVCAQFQRLNRAGTGTVSKAALRQAVADTDAWVEANQAAFNTALNAEARAGLSTTQKSVLFAYVLARRVGLFHADEDS